MFGPHYMQYGTRQQTVLKTCIHVSKGTPFRKKNLKLKSLSLFGVTILSLQRILQ